MSIKMNNCPITNANIDVFAGDEYIDCTFRNVKITAHDDIKGIVNFSGSWFYDCKFFYNGEEVTEDIIKSLEEQRHE